MKTSDTIKDLAKALVAANKGVKNPIKNAVNPHFKNRYSTLDAVIEAYKESYLNAGISVLENPKTEDGKIGVEVTFLHESGQFITHDPFMLPATKQDAQGYGSASTYARRYTLSAVLNIAAEEDDDGNAASQPGKPNTQSKPPESNLITPAQMKALGAKVGNISKATEQDQAAVYQSAASHFKIGKTAKELTKAEASKIIDYLATLE